MPYPSLTRPAPRDRARRRSAAAASDIAAADALRHVWGYGVGLDMTRRDLQGEAKKLGRPWDTGKGFEQSAPIGPIRRAEEC